MMIIAFLLLLAPGFVSMRILWSRRTIDRSSCLLFLSDYMIYSFLIMLCTYGFMFITYPDRTVSFSEYAHANSSILTASFVVKYSLAALLSSLFLPVILPRVLGVCKKLEDRRKRLKRQSHDEKKGLK